MGRERVRGRNLPKGLQHCARGTTAALDARRSVQLEQHHAHNVAQEQQIEEYGYANGHHQYVVEVVVNHPAARGGEKKRGRELAKCHLMNCKTSATSDPHTHPHTLPHLLLCLLAAATETTRHAIDKDDNGRRTPAEGNQPFDQLLLRYECSHQHRVQVETLAQHPRVVGQQEIV